MPHATVLCHVRSMENLPHRIVQPSSDCVNTDQVDLKPFAELPVCDNRKTNAAHALSWIHHCFRSLTYQPIDAWQEVPELFEEWRDAVGVAGKELPNLFDSMLNSPEYVYSRTVCPVR